MDLRHITVEFNGQPNVFGNRGVLLCGFHHIEGHCLKVGVINAIENIVSSNDSGKVDRAIEAEKLVFTGNNAGREPLTALTIDNEINRIDTDLDTKFKSVISGSTVNGKEVIYAAANEGEGTNIRKNYYRSASNTPNANTITINTSSPSGGNIGDIWIQYSN